MVLNGGLDFDRQDAVGGLCLGTTFDTIDGVSDAVDYLITTADTIMNSGISLIRGIPGIMQIGGQEVPTYDLTVRVGTQRS